MLRSLRALILALLVAAPLSAEAQPAGNWWERLRADPNATFAGAVAAFTLALVLVGGWQARRLRQTVEATKAAERRELRAYVGVRELALKLPGFDEPAYTPADLTPGYVHKDFVLVTMENFGQTPAYDVAIHVNWQSMPYPQRLPTNFSYPD
ncbi:MAG TPA: hypothetical protein VGK54_07495, partial [Chloroflexota bacterium]